MTIFYIMESVVAKLCSGPSRPSIFVPPQVYTKYDRQVSEVGFGTLRIWDFRQYSMLAKNMWIARCVPWRFGPLQRVQIDFVVLSKYEWNPLEEGGSKGS